MYKAEDKGQGEGKKELTFSPAVFGDRFTLFLVTSQKFEFETFKKGMIFSLTSFQCLETATKS